jgi:hypothetical protein
VNSIWDDSYLEVEGRVVFFHEIISIQPIIDTKEDVFSGVRRSATQVSATLEIVSPSVGLDMSLRPVNNSRFELLRLTGRESLPI